MKTRYVCYLSAAFRSEEDLRLALRGTVGDLRGCGIYRLDMEIPDEVDSNLVRLIFKGLAVDHEYNPNDYVLVICKESDRAVEELNIRLQEAIDAARDALVPWSEVAAALTEFANPE